jgi:RNA polymerase sigma-70 factor (ECF subfamily)
MTMPHGESAPRSGPESRVPVERVEAFVALLGQHQRRLHLFVTSLVLNAADAEDVLQETNLVLWREFHRFEVGTNFVSWACTVAFNQVLAWRKRRQRDRLVFSDAFLHAVYDEQIATADLLELRSHALAQCVARIPPHHRELLQLRYDEGRAVESIAEKLHRTDEAIYRMLSRIRQTLYECVSSTLAHEGSR